MKFTVLYPDGNKDRDIEHNGLTLYCVNYPLACWHCGDNAYWVNVNFEAAFCSQECLNAKWAEFVEAYNRGLK